jgi:esterase/lipase superfamily enzyme
MSALMITNRNVAGNELGNRCDALRYFKSDKPKLHLLRNWEEQTQTQFQKLILEIVDGFPEVPEEQNEKQKHISFFIHGYNNNWKESVDRYQGIQSKLFSGASGLGQLILFSWPSNDHANDYLPDRDDARKSAPGLAQVFVDLHDTIVKVQRATALKNGTATPCRDKVSVISHSMGNWVLQSAMASAAKRLNSPQLITLVHQCAMVAADVDNDIFQESQPDDSDGSLMANLCYRICALYTGLDQTLGASAGLKHFGTRRLGRSGLADRNAVYDNVWDHDVTELLGANPKNVHSAVFETKKTMDLLRLILIGRDRGQLSPT